MEHIEEHGRRYHAYKAGSSYSGFLVIVADRCRIYTAE
jgi:hypothetical protein